MKYRVWTSHGPVTLDGSSEQDVQQQAKNLTYGPTRVYAIDPLKDDGSPVNAEQANRNAAIDAAFGFPRS